MIENEKMLKATIAAAKTGMIGDKKLSLYSRPALVLLRYVDLTTTKFSRGGAAGQALAEAVARKHPELWQYIESQIIANKITTRGDKNIWGNIQAPGMNNIPIDKVTLTRAIEETQIRSGRIVTIYNPKLTALFKYLAGTTPRFSVSADAAKLLECVLEEKYPKLWKNILKQIEPLK